MAKKPGEGTYPSPKPGDINPTGGPTAPIESSTDAPPPRK